MRIEAVGDRVILKRLERPKTEGSIIRVTDNVPYNKGVIVHIGSGASHNLQPKDTVVFVESYGTYKEVIDGEEFLIIPGHDVLAVLKE